MYKNIPDFPPKEDPKPITHHTSYNDAVRTINNEHQLKDFKVVINKFLKTTLGSKYGAGTFYAWANDTHQLVWISEGGELQITYLQDAKVYILQFDGVIISGDRLSDLTTHALNEFADTELWKQLHLVYESISVHGGTFVRTPTKMIDYYPTLTDPEEKGEDIITWKNEKMGVVTEHDPNLHNAPFTVIIHNDYDGRGLDLKAALDEAMLELLTKKYGFKQKNTDSNKKIK